MALPLNLFYNTGIATYVWLLSNRKTAERLGKVKLIDASGWSQPLRKNLGKKNCELGPADLERVMAAYAAMEESEQSKLFANAAFGYWKVTVERPLRRGARRPGIGRSGRRRWRSLARGWWRNSPRYDPGWRRFSTTGAARKPMVRRTKEKLLRSEGS
ncbi:MAG: N-6 DNA methylase, partial [Cyanobium sp.]